MSVFYKFKSALTFDTIQFDDIHISLQDFKKSVIQQKQLGKNTNFDLQVTNAETNEVYSDENAMIPKNSSLIVVRVPLAGSQKKVWDIGDHLGSKIAISSDYILQENPSSIVVKSADLAAMNASEEDKIQAMMYQSTVNFDPSNYSRTKPNYSGDPPSSYICHKCQHPGHWIKDCPITVVPDIKKSSGIPQSFMTPVEDASVPGALMTPAGTFAVPTIDMQAYKEGKIEKPFIASEETEEPAKPIIPEDLVCSLCQDLLTDAVMMPCCGNSFCDECIRNALIESEDNQCPDCKEKDTSPETLIPNRFLRNSVNSFRNKTGYSGGGQRVKKNETITAAKSPIIEQEHEQDVQIVSIETAKVSPKQEITVESSEGEKGNAICVLGTRDGRNQTNGTSRLPHVHVDHRSHMCRPNNDPVPKDVSRPHTISSLEKVSSKDIDRKKSPPLIGDVPHPSSFSNRITGLPPLPNTSHPPPGFGSHPIQTLGPLYGGNLSGVMPGYGPPLGVNTGMMPHMGQGHPSRMYPSSYSNQPMYQSQMGGGYRPMSNHHRMRMHHVNTYPEGDFVEDPLEAFERHLREREKQDRLRRNRGRHSRSRSPHLRHDSRARSHQRSRSRSISKTRSHSKSPIRKESPSLPMKRDSRSPIARRSASRSRSRPRIRSRSRSIGRSPLPRSKSRTPLKNKRSVSLSPSPPGFKKRSRTPSPLTKKILRRSISRSRSPSVSRSRKRRRTKSRSRSISSRSRSRGRSYSRSISPRNRPVYSPTYGTKTKRYSRSPSRQPYVASRHRGGGHYRDDSPYQSHSYYEHNEFRGYRRGSRNSRFSRGYGGRYNSNHSYGHRGDRYGNYDRYDDHRGRYPEMNNGRGYAGGNDYSRSRKDQYYQPTNQQVDYDYNAPNHGYNDIAPPGVAVGDHVLPTNYVSGGGSNFADDRGGDKYRPTSDYDDRRPRDYETDKPHDYHRRSRERHGEYEKSSRRHSSRQRNKSPSPSDRRADERKRRSRVRSVDKENKPSSRDDRKRNDVESSQPSKEWRARSQETAADKTSKSSTTVVDERTHKENKKDKSKRKKKKESETEKKKRKKLKTKKEEDTKTNDEKSSETATKRDHGGHGVTAEKETEKVAKIESEPEPKTKRKDVSYGEKENANVDVKVTENCTNDESTAERKPSKNEVVNEHVPELSKWERDDVPSPSAEESKTNAIATPSVKSVDNEKKIVTSEILKRAENVLFQKAVKATTRQETKESQPPPPLPTIAAKEKDEIQPFESCREAKRSGNSIQVTVPVSGSGSKLEDETGRMSSRISAKDRLGAKVDEKSHSPVIRSLVEPKTKPRSLSSAVVKSVVDVKHPSKSESSTRDEKPEKKESTSKKHHDEKKRRDSRHHADSKHSKRHRSKTSKEKGGKHSRKSSEEEVKPKREPSKEKESVRSKQLLETKVEPVENAIEKTVETNANDGKSMPDKKKPCLDEAHFEPDYDLTSESENEKERKRSGTQVEEGKKTEPEPTSKSTLDKALVQRIIEQTTNASVSTSESSSDSSSDSSLERRKRKRSSHKTAKKKKKVKKKKASSESESEDESSESESDSDTKRKHKKSKHKYKAKKSKSSKKKKKGKHKQRS